MKSVLEEFVSDLISNCISETMVHFETPLGRSDLCDEIRSYLKVWIERKQQKSKREMIFVLEDMKKRFPMSETEKNLIQQFIDMAYPI